MTKYSGYMKSIVTLKKVRLKVSSGLQQIKFEHKLEKELLLISCFVDIITYNILQSVVYIMFYIISYY
jgi:hypothetical protein